MTQFIFELHADSRTDLDDGHPFLRIVALGVLSLGSLLCLYGLRGTVLYFLPRRLRDRIEQRHHG